MSANTTMNVICPICGRPIPEDLPPVDFSPIYHPHHQDDEQASGFRVCSKRCADQAAADPARYHAAAETNRVAG